MGLETHMKFMHGRARFSGKKFFCPKNCENEPKKNQKQGFLNLLEDLMINFY